MAGAQQGDNQDESMFVLLAGEAYETQGIEVGFSHRYFLCPASHTALRHPHPTPCLFSAVLDFLTPLHDPFNALFISLFLDAAA